MTFDHLQHNLTEHVHIRITEFNHHTFKSNGVLKSIIFNSNNPCYNIAAGITIKHTQTLTRLNKFMYSIQWQY